jgi:hypothetical protein
MKRNIMLGAAALWAIAHLSAFGQYVEIGTGTGTQRFVPISGDDNYGWSHTIYLQSEIGAPVMISGLAYYVGNTPNNFVMDSQKIYLKHTTLSAFPSAAYENPLTAGFSLVFEGSVTWNGTGWAKITFDTAFFYNGQDNLIVCWENRDGSWGSGYPTYRYTPKNSRAKYKFQSYGFPLTSGSLSPYVPNIRLLANDANPVPADGSQAVVVDARPTVAWSNPGWSMSNALYFSVSSADVVAANPAVRVLGEGGGLYSCYTNPVPLACGTTYHWAILQYYGALPFMDGPFAFTTEPEPQSAYPWKVDFENGGALPAFWIELPVAGQYGWQVQAGGADGAPAAPWQGDYNAAFGGVGSLAVTRLVSPVLNLDGAAAPLLTFMHAQAARGGVTDELRVYYRTATTNDWTLLPGATYLAPTDGWVRRTLALPEPTGRYYLAFEGKDNGGHGPCIDAVSVLTEHASLTLEVFDCDGARLPAAAFAVFAPSGNADAYDAGITDTDGAGTVHGLPAGPVDYSVDEAFHNPVDLTRTLVAGTHATQRVDLAVATHLSGIVRAADSSGARVEGATVELYTPEPDAALIASETTDAFGQYRFSRVTDGDYQLAASHPAYTPSVTGITVNASASHTLVIQPRSGTFSDVYVQVHCALSGLPVAGAEVVLTVYESGGSLLYQQTLVCDADGNLCFRGVPSGTAYFDCNRPGANHQPWWEPFVSPPQAVANSKMVTVRLEPKKGQTTVDLDFAPTSVWGGAIDAAPFIQNFWVEARGYDPETGTPLYPARTEVTDYAGKATFAELPTLPTLITVRRPGFVAQSTLIYPDNNAVFPALLPMDRPAITPNTVWNLTVTQTLFRCFPYAMSGMPAITVEGLPNSNTEGYFENYRYAAKAFSGLPMPLETLHGEMSAWGQGQYLLSPGETGYLYTGGNFDDFYCQFDFPPHLVTLAEGETNNHQITASFVPSIVEGTLFAADAVTDEGVTLYTPAAGKEIKFVLHEGVRFMYQNGEALWSATTDTNGYYRLALPPGCYGIEIPSMEGYWGYKVIASGLVGWNNGESGWPYARTNNLGVSGTSYVYDDSGIGLGSGHQTQLDLYVHCNRYAIQTAVTEESPLRERILFLTSDGQDGASKNVKDLLESGTRLTLSDGASATVRKAAGGLRPVWTNLVGGTLTVTDDDHPYLSSSSVVSRVTFDWGDYPGAPPASVPPTGSLLNVTPLPMILHNAPAFSIASENELTDKPTVTVIYYDGDETPAETTTTPEYVAFKDHPGKVYRCFSVDAARADTYYFTFTLHDGKKKIYAVPGGGPYVVNTISQQPAELPLAPYDMDIIAVNFDNPAETIEGFPFTKDGEPIETPCHLGNLATSVYIDWNYDATSAWQRYSYNSFHYDINPTNAPVLVTAKLFCRPRIQVNGSIKNALSGLPVQGANVEIRRSNATTVGLENKSVANGAFGLSVFNSFDGHLVSVNATGYQPFRKRYEFGPCVTGTNDNYFIVSLGDIPLVPAALTVTGDSWDRQGYVLHGVQSAGSGQESGTGEAVQLTVSASAGVPAQAYEIQRPDAPDGAPGSMESNAWEDAVTEVWLVDTRRKTGSGTYEPYLAATPESYFPVSESHLPPPTDPDKIRLWLDRISESGQVIVKLQPGESGAQVAATGTVSVATLRPGTLAPMLVARSESGACAMLALGENPITSVKLPRWLAFAADTLASASAAQGAYADLKSSYLSKVPDGKLSALPSLTGGISEEDGYLTYTYGLGVAWEEGADAPSKGGLSIGPGLLGMQFESEAKIGFNGQSQALSFEVGGKIGKEDIDLEDYAPAFLKKIGIEGTLNKVFGEASTRRSTALVGGLWAEREMCTSVGAGLDLTLRYNLEGMTGKLPYVGPLLTLADKTGALKLYGRLDAGGNIQNTSTWRTLEPGRAEEVGEPDPLVTRPILARSDDLQLTPNRHCFGGQENNSGTYSNEFKLGVSFGAGFEGSGLGDHLNVRAGIEITGNEDDLVAGQPSLVITPNTFGDWPPIKRVQGDVNAFIRAKLDAYITEIEKDWTINLARIDHQFTTESLLTMADLTVNTVERPVASTVFTGMRPAVVRNLPKGSSYALCGDRLAFGRYDQGLGRTDLVVSLAEGDGFAEPVTVATGVEGLGKVLLVELPAGNALLIWEERPGLPSNLEAYSVLRAARFDGSAWQSAQQVAELHSHLCEMVFFETALTNSLVYVQSPRYADPSETAVRALGYDATSDTWGAPQTVQTITGRRDIALAAVGRDSPEPGRIVYASDSGEVVSRYWDGWRGAVPGGESERTVTAAPSRRVALCPEPEEELLFATVLTEDGNLLLHAYVPDPLRDPQNPAYDWNGREGPLMWPFVTNLTAVAGTVDDLANGWLPDCSRLLNVWSRLGGVYASSLDVAAAMITVAELASSPDGTYADLRVAPLSNGTARVAACYTASGVRELRVFVVDTAAGAHDEDLNNDGISDMLELALVDADPEDAILDIRDVNGADDFDGDGFNNAVEWANGTRADSAKSYPRLGVGVDAVMPLAREDGLLPGRFLIGRGDADDAVQPLTVYFAIGGTAAEDADYETMTRSVEIPATQRAATVTVQPLADTDVEGVEDVVLTLLPDKGYALAVNTQATVRIRDASHDAWRGRYFTPVQLADPLVGTDDADPDEDGIPNALERALGTDPWLADPTELDMALADGYLYLGYRYDPLVEDAVITINAATNLLESVWSPVAGTLLYREPLPDQREGVLYRIPLENPAGFYRLKLEVP